MNDAIAAALTATNYSRLARTQKLAEAAEAADAEQQYVLIAAGYQGDKLLGQLPNGGLLEVVPISNGAIQQGQTFIGIKRGGTVYGSWLPR